MEILAANVSYAGAIVFGIICLVAFICGLWGVFAKDSDKVVRILSGVAVIVGLAGCVSTALNPTSVTYDTIVTDWNVVFEQGYEVVGTNGKIVILRKGDQ